MRELNQGEDYIEEEEDLDEEDLLEDEGDEETDAELTTIFGIRRELVIIGGVIILIIIVAIVIFLVWKSKNENTAVYPDATVDTDYVDPGYVDPGYVETTSYPIDVYDDVNNYIGQIYGIDYGMEITDANGVGIGVIDPDGANFFQSSDGMTSGWYNPYNSDPSTDINDYLSGDGSEGNMLGSEEAIVQLRKLGYTGDEIAIAQAQGIDVQALIEEATALRDAEAIEALQRMSDHASDEFKTITNYSIFGSPYVEFPFKVDTPIGTDFTFDYTVNADYSKVPTYGYQLYLKVKIADDFYVFYETLPRRYASLPDEGNIVMRVTCRIFGNEEQTNLYITDMNEVLDMSTLTTNPNESGVNMEDLINNALSE